jgi:hypothetical protein
MNVHASSGRPCSRIKASAQRANADSRSRSVLSRSKRARLTNRVSQTGPSNFLPGPGYGREPANELGQFPCDGPKVCVMAHEELATTYTTHCLTTGKRLILERSPTDADWASARIVGRVTARFTDGRTSTSGSNCWKRSTSPWTWISGSSYPVGTLS